MEVERKKGVRPISYVIGAIYAVIMVLIVIFIMGSANGGRALLGAVSPGGGEVPVDFLILWAPVTILSLLLMALPRKLGLSSQELTLIYSMSMMGSLMPTAAGILGYVFATPGLCVHVPAFTQTFIALENPLFMPKDINVIKAMTYGGKLVPWDAWMTPIIFWSTFLIVQNLLFITTGCLLRRLYIELEALPFPLATGTSSIIKTATVSEAREKSRKWLLIGIILGIVATSYLWIEPLFPGLGIRSQNAYIDLTPLALLPWVPLYFNFNVFYIAAGYFIPTRILLSAIIFYVILFMIVPIIATYAGIFPPFPTGIRGGVGFTLCHNLLNGFPGGGAGWVNWGQGSWGYGTIIWGALFACTLWPMFKLRASIKSGIVKFVRSLRGESVGEEDISIRWLGISWIILYIIYSVFLSYATYWYLPIWVSLLCTALFLFIYVAALSVGRGYAGDYAGHSGVFLPYLFHIWSFFTMIGRAIGLGAPFKPPKITQNAMISFSYNRLIRIPGETDCVTGGSGQRILELFKVGSITGTRDRDILVSSIIGMILGIIIAIPLWLWFSYTYGIGVKWTNYHGWTTAYGLSWGWLREAFPKWTHAKEGPAPTVWLWYIFGAIIAIIIYKIQERWPAFPLHPIGLVLSPLCLITFAGWIIALILKQITLKIGGTELYEEKGVPIASGVLGGWSIMLVISHVVMSLRQIGVIA